MLTCKGVQNCKLFIPPYMRKSDNTFSDVKQAVVFTARSLRPVGFCEILGAWGRFWGQQNQKRMAGWSCVWFLKCLRNACSARLGLDPQREIALRKQPPGLEGTVSWVVMTMDKVLPASALPSTWLALKLGRRQYIMLWGKSPPFNLLTPTYSHALRLPREIVGAPSLEVFKARSNGALSNLV